VPAEIVKRQIGHFHQVDPGYRLDVANRMGLAVTELSGGAVE
jgi:hypothetical protein